jgi:hypothetical protein
MFVAMPGWGSSFFNNDPQGYGSRLKAGTTKNN